MTSRWQKQTPILAACGIRNYTTKRLSILIQISKGVRGMRVNVDLLNEESS